MAKVNDRVNLAVVKDEDSFTGYSIIDLSNGSGIPASIWEIKLWRIIEALSLDIEAFKQIESPARLAAEAAMKFAEAARAAKAGLVDDIDTADIDDGEEQ